MTPYHIIDVVQFLLGCATTWAFIRWRRTQSPRWLEGALALQAVHAEADRAEARQRQRDRND